MSAVDQGYKYAVNLPCDWVIVTNIRQTRLYYKGANQQTYERFDTERLVADPAHLAKLAFLLGAERMLPPVQGGARCHLYDLLAASERAGRELTKAYYRAYAELREEAFDGIAAANPDVDRRATLTATQKVLDRPLFCAFCEDRGLLPPLTIQKGKLLTAAALAALRDEYDRTIAPARFRSAEALVLERRLSDLVNVAYGLSPDEDRLMWESAPPRMP